MQPDNNPRRLSEMDAVRIKNALLQAAEKGCQDAHGAVDPERLARGLIAAFGLVDAATAVADSGA